MDSEVRAAIFNAVFLHFEAKAQRARANLLNYLNNSVGVGEHADIMEECINLIEEIDSATSCSNLWKQMLNGPKTSQEVDEQ